VDALLKEQNKCDVTCHNVVYLQFVKYCCLLFKCEQSIFFVHVMSGKGKGTLIFNCRIGKYLLRDVIPLFILSYCQIV